MEIRVGIQLNMFSIALQLKFTIGLFPLKNNRKIFYSRNLSKKCEILYKKWIMFKFWKQKNHQLGWRNAQLVEGIMGRVQSRVTTDHHARYS